MAKKKDYPDGVKLTATKVRAVAMQEFGTAVERDATNGVIYGESGEIVKDGLRVVCPHCGEIGLFNGGNVNIWTVGAIKCRECTKCRKQFNTISLTVPADMTPEDFYLKIKEGVRL